MPRLTDAVPAGRTELRSRFRIDLGEYVTALGMDMLGTQCMVGLGDGRLVSLDPASGQERFTVEAHREGLLGLSLSPDGRHILTCGQDTSARLWTNTGVLLRELPGGGQASVDHVAWSPIGSKFATASGRHVRVWSVEGDPLVETAPLASTVSALAWRYDGTGVAAACYGGVHILPLVHGARARHLPWKGSLVSLAWSPDAKVIACGSQDCSVHFWRLASGKDSEMTGYSFKPRALSWDFESKLLATSGHATITVWDFRGKGPEGSTPLQLDAHQGLCTQLAFSPRRALLASGSQDTSVLLWAPRRGTKPSGYGFLGDEVTALCWHPTEDTLLAADASGCICAFAAS